MRLTIQKKLFFALTLFAALLITVMAWGVRWNLGQGFQRYTATVELARLDWLVELLDEEFQRQQSWNHLRNTPDQVWRKLIRPNRRGDFNGTHNAPLGQERPYEFGPGQNRESNDTRNEPAQRLRAAPANDLLRVGPRLALLDAKKNWVAGAALAPGVHAERAIQSGGQTVGYLYLIAAPTANEALDQAFLTSQTHSLWLAVGIGMSLALLVAWLLARQFVRPISALGQATRQIASGNYQVNISSNTQDELGELAEHFARMSSQLASMEEARRAWISDASHELRTPLAVLQAEIEALQDGIRQPDPPTLSRLLKQIQQLNTLVSDLRRTLDAAASLRDMAQQAFDPLEIIEELLISFGDRFDHAQLQIEQATFDKKRRQIIGDPDRWRQVVSNLLENTLRYTDAGGSLRISARPDGNRLVIAFDDTAPAPPKTALPRLFERFYRAESSRNRGLGGSGLGLAICKSIIEAHGGRIHAALSTLGGLCIRIELPLKPQ